jgi:23S rRNA pseudouridine2457 synthase
MTLGKFRLASDKKYIAFNKPYAVLCQFTLPEGSTKKTLAAFGFPEDVYSVGRLDFDSEGLIILTDDGRLNRKLLSPGNNHRRTYFVCVENEPSEPQLQILRSGVVIEGKKTMPAQAKLLTEEPPLPLRPVPIRQRKNIPTAWVELTLTEGRNRQVRKMTAAIGCPTLRLVRIAIGCLSLFDLKLLPGEWKILSENELSCLFMDKRDKSCQNMQKF